MNLVPLLMALALPTPPDLPDPPDPSELLEAVSSTDNQAGLVVAPDGRQAFFTRWPGRWGDPPIQPPRIMSLRRRNGTWSVPETAWFSGTFADDDPFVDPEGQWLYFTSDRPADPSGEPGDIDLWRVRLAPGARPERLDVSEPGPEFSPVVTRDALYFAAMRADGAGQGDLYRSPRVGDGFGPATPLGPAINATTGEWNVHVDPDASLLLMEASGRPTNVTESGDLYGALGTAAGWTPALPLTALNTGHSELLPRPAGAQLLYTQGNWDSGRAGIRRVPLKLVEAALASAWHYRLWVVNRSSHSLAMVDPRSGQTLLTVDVGAGPHLLSRDGRFGVVAAHGAYPRPHEEPVHQRPPWVEEDGGRVTALDLVTGRIHWQVETGCRRAHGSAVMGDRVAVTCEELGQVLVLDRDDGGMIRRLDSGGRGSHVLWPIDDDTLAVSNVDDGTVSLLSTDPASPPRVIDTGGGSEALTVDESGRLWVAATRPSRLVALDPSTTDIVARIDDPCSFPIDLAVQQGTLWVACHGSRELVGFENGASGNERRIELPSGPLNLAIHPLHALAWVSLPRSNAVVEVDLARGVVTRSFRVGIEPDGLQLVPLPDPP